MNFETGRPVWSGRLEIVTYPTAGVNGGSDGPVGEIDQFPDIVDIGVGASREHGATAGKSKPVLLEPDPVLILLLHRQFLMRNIRKPGEIPALRPWERQFIPDWRRNPALQNLSGGRAVPLSVDQSVPVELERPFPVLAGGVFIELRVTRWEVRATRLWDYLEVGGGVMGGEIEVDNGGFRRSLEGGGWGSTSIIPADEKNSFSDGVLPNADEIKGGAENRNQSNCKEIEPPSFEWEMGHRHWRVQETGENRVSEPDEQKQSFPPSLSLKTPPV